MLDRSAVGQLSSLPSRTKWQLLLAGNTLRSVLSADNRGLCKKTTGPTGSRWVGQWWVGPKGGITSVSLSRPLQTTGQHSGVQLFNSQLFDTNLNSTQLQQSRPIQIKQCKRARADRTTTVSKRLRGVVRVTASNDDAVPAYSDYGETVM